MPAKTAREMAATGGDKPSPFKADKAAPKEAARKSRPSKRKSDGHTPAGRKIIAGLTAVLEALKAGGQEAVERRFRTTRVRRDPFPTDQVTAADAAAIRASVGATQPVFASLIGVSTATVRAWESGTKPVSGMAQKFLDLIRRDPGPWADRVREAATPPTNGPA